MNFAIILMLGRIPRYNRAISRSLARMARRRSPGTYYLVVGGPWNAQGSAFGWIETSNPVVSAGLGISNIGFLRGVGSNAEPSYGPALTFSTLPVVPFVTITGTAAVPEGSSTKLLLAGCLCLGFASYARNVHSRRRNLRSRPFIVR